MSPPRTFSNIPNIFLDSIYEFILGDIIVTWKNLQNLLFMRLLERANASTLPRHLPFLDLTGLVQRLDSVVESLLSVSLWTTQVSNFPRCNPIDLFAKFIKANPKLANRRDDDERLPIHWAVSNGHIDIAILLSSVKDFDPDVEVGFESLTYVDSYKALIPYRRMVLGGHHS